MRIRRYAVLDEIFLSKGGTGRAWGRERRELTRRLARRLYHDPDNSSRIPGWRDHRREDGESAHVLVAFFCVWSLFIVLNILRR